MITRLVTDDEAWTIANALRTACGVYAGLTMQYNDSSPKLAAQYNRQAKQAADWAAIFENSGKITIEGIELCE